MRQALVERMEQAILAIAAHRLDSSRLPGPVDLAVRRNAVGGLQRSVQVDQQTRVAGRQQWRVESQGKLFGQRQGADIPSDVFFRRGLVQAERCNSSGMCRLACSQTRTTGLRPGD